MKQSDALYELHATVSVGEHTRAPVGVRLPNNQFTPKQHETLVQAFGLLYKDFKHKARVMSLLEDALHGYARQNTTDFSPFHFVDNEITIAIQRYVRKPPKQPSLLSRLFTALFRK